MRKKYGSCLPLKFIHQYSMNIIFETTKIIILVYNDYNVCKPYVANDENVM